MNIQDFTEFDQFIQFIEQFGHIKFRNISNYNKQILQNFNLCKPEQFENKSVPEIMFLLKGGEQGFCICCSKPTRWSGNRYKRYCSSICSTKENIGKKRPNQTEKLNAFYQDKERSKEARKRISDNSKRIFSDQERRKEISKRIKTSIENGNFTPCVTNSWTKWETIVNGKKYRSSFEGLFALYCEKNSIPVEYESLRIRYFDSDKQKERIYIVDFVDNKSKVVYEIKPNSLVEEKNNKEKQISLLNWCANNNYTYKLLTEKELKCFFAEINDTENDFLKNFHKAYRKWLDT